MNSTLRSSMLAAAIFAMPLTGFAQSNAPIANMGSNKSVTAPPSGTPGSQMAPADSNVTPKIPSTTERNPDVPGATGNAVVPGTNSTVAGDRAATVGTKTGTSSTGSGK